MCFIGDQVNYLTDMKDSYMFDSVDLYNSIANAFGPYILEAQSEADNSLKG